MHCYLISFNNPISIKLKKNKINEHHDITADSKQFPTEAVLVMQAGGSLGAYECGVFKALAKHNVWFDIIAGTSIGSVNATVIADSIRSKLQKNNTISL
jgi:predicted acylesterase/phospholipase RssA